MKSASGIHFLAFWKSKCVMAGDRRTKWEWGILDRGEGGLYVLYKLLFKIDFMCVTVLFGLMYIRVLHACLVLGGL